MFLRLLLITKISITKLIRKTKCQFGVLEHVVKAEVFDLVFGGVDMVIGIGKCSLDDKGARVSSLARGRMV